MARDLWILMLIGCGSAPPAVDGKWILEGEGVSGTISGEPASGCRDGRVLVGLWGPSWGTPGIVAAEVEATEEGGHWFYFSMETGVGAGQAALYLQGEEARLPLGGRAGEFDVVLNASRGVWPDNALEDVQIEAQAAIEAEQEYWAMGSFKIFEDEQLIGDVHFAGSGPTMISVYDTWWLTPQPVVAQRKDDGTDMVLAFPVEPSIAGETASLRVNVPTREAVVPRGLHPLESDRRLRLVPGAVQPDVREEMMAVAVVENTELERRAVTELLSQLASSAYQGPGECRELTELSAEMRAMLSGYRLVMEASGEHCEIDIKPDPVQHGRRFRGVVGPKGSIERD